MFKKVLSLSLALMMALALAACGGTNNDQTSDSSGAAGGSFTGTLPELINEMYEKQPVEIEVAEPIEIDLNDADAVRYYTGLSDAAAVKEAYFSESMIGSQAYSLVAVRVNDAADTAATAQAMFDGIDQAKWVCAVADALAVGASGDIIVLAMADSQLGDDIHIGLRDAFASVVGASKLDVSLDRIDPNAVPAEASGVN